MPEATIAVLGRQQAKTEPLLPKRGESKNSPLEARGKEREGTSGRTLRRPARGGRKLAGSARGTICPKGEKGALLH